MPRTLGLDWKGRGGHDASLTQVMKNAKVILSIKKKLKKKKNCPLCCLKLGSSTLCSLESASQVQVTLRPRILLVEVLDESGQERHETANMLAEILRIHRTRVLPT